MTLDRRSKFKMRRQHIDDDGIVNHEYTAKVQISGHGEVVMQIPGTSVEDAEQTLLAWLAEEEWRTVEADLDGSRSRLTFRTSWVAGFRFKETK